MKFKVPTLTEKIVKELVHGIVIGRWPVGEMLPTEKELCERFKCSRVTIRRALDAIEKAGMIERRPRIGTKVISTGAGNDLQKASAIARNMVTRYGMSDRLGNVVFDSGHDEVFIGRSMAQTKNYSEEVAALIDEEVKALVDGAYARCQAILTQRRHELDVVAEYLLQYENMDAKTFARVFEHPEDLPAPASWQAVEADAEEDREAGEREAPHGED